MTDQRHPFAAALVVSLVLIGCPDAQRAATLPDGGVGTGEDAASVSEAGAEPESGADAESPGGDVDREWSAWALPAASAPTTTYSVTDKVTKDETTRLSWEKHFQASRTWQEARDYCDTLLLEEHSDWRLPTRIELWSIVDFGRASPSINPVAFPETPAAAFWSSSSQEPEFRALAVAFDDGHAGEGEVTAHFAVRCVRDDRTTGGARTPAEHFVVSSETVRDPWTNLTWQKATPPARYSFADALVHCQDLTIGGEAGWRLPGVREILSLASARTKTGWPDGAFPDDNLSTRLLWTATSLAANADTAWQYRYTAGATLESAAKTDGLASVLCVK